MGTFRPEAGQGDGGFQRPERGTDQPLAVCEVSPGGGAAGTGGDFAVAGDLPGVLCWAGRNRYSAGSPVSLPYQGKFWFGCPDICHRFQATRAYAGPTAGGGQAAFPGCD